MRENFPKKKDGDNLSPRHVNQLSDVASRFGKLWNGGFLSINQGESSVSIGGFPPWQQFVLEITNTQINDDDETDSGLYLVKFRFYNHTDEEWATDDGEYELDGTEFDLTELQKGEKVIGFWHAQRGMFVPISIGKGSVRMIHGELVDSIDDTDASFEINNVVAIYGPNPTDDTSEETSDNSSDASDDSSSDGSGVEITVQNSHLWEADSGARVVAVFCEEDKQWEAIQIDCPSPGSSSSSISASSQSV